VSTHIALPAAALAAALSAAPGGQAIEQIAPPVPPDAVATTDNERREPAAYRVSVPQLPEQARVVDQPQPHIDTPGDVRRDEAAIAYSAVIGAVSAKPSAQALHDLGPATIADVGAVVAAAGERTRPANQAPAVPVAKP